jgi:ammonia channel protein AmtB
VVSLIQIAVARISHRFALPNVFACGGGALLLWQFIAIVSSAAWAAAWTFVIFKVTSKFTPIRISERGEVIGLDLECHGEMLVSRAKVHSPWPFLFT